MRILIALTYYRPHVSGLTIYVERLAHALAARGHQVTLLTSQYDRALPRYENDHGVNVVRVPVMLRVSKGAVMPTIGWHATRLALTHDILNLHLPQFDAAGLALRGRLFERPVVLTYHSDLALPPSFAHWLAGRVIALSHRVALRLADVIVTNTEDFARHSPILSRYLAKVHAIPPPIEIPFPTPDSCAMFRSKYNLDAPGPLVGIVGRVAAEKGIEYLLEALPAILAQFPDALVVHVGPREPVGEAEYARRLAPLLARYRDKYRFIGIITTEELAAFFASCAVHVLPSVNSTETFGMVQIEAALCGTPTVATALPGVRIASQLTGMGRVVPPRDSRALAEAICEVLAHRKEYVRPQAEIAHQFAPDTIAARYEALFEHLRARQN
jgi:glycosyltransferase involved in cell wall biosynthesis